MFSALSPVDQRPQGPRQRPAAGPVGKFGAGGIPGGLGRLHLAGGFGSAVLEHLADRDVLRDTRVLRFGLPDRYVTHGKPALLREEVGLTPEAVAERVAQAVLEPSLA